MKTILPAAIATIDEAKAFLKALHDNNESYHPEDSAFTISWDMSPEDFPTADQCRQLDKLMGDIYGLKGNDGRSNNLLFDPCEFVLNLKGMGGFGASSCIQKHDTWNSGGGIDVDVITLKNGMIVSITEDCMVAFKSQEDFEENNEIGHVNFV